MLIKSHDSYCFWLKRISILYYLKIKKKQVIMAKQALRIEILANPEDELKQVKKLW